MNLTTFTAGVLKPQNKNVMMFLFSLQASKQQLISTPRDPFSKHVTPGLA